MNNLQILIKYKTIWEILANKHRIDIIFELLSKPSTWSELMYDLRINPRALASHLKYLQENNIIIKDERKYTLTEKGVSIANLDFINTQELEKLAQFKIRFPRRKQ